MLSIETITAGYDENVVLRDVSLSVERGRFVGLIGPNGCGKTTLLRVITGILKPSEGRVRLGDRDIQAINRRELARIVACLSQDIELDFSFTVREVAAMGRAPHLPRFGGETKKDRDIVEQALDLADVSHLADRLVTELSGGERQRAFIAMCLAQEPEIFLLDEPTSQLDIGHQLAVLELIRKLNRENGVTVVGVFHDLNLAAEYCQDLVVLDRSRIAASGSPQDVLTTDMLRDVYGTDVHVDQNPLSGNPHIIIAAKHQA